MPIYPFLCPDHGEVEIVGGYEKARNATCPKCDKPMHRKYTPVAHSVDFRPGWQPAFGKWIDTKRELSNLVSEKGLIRG